MVGREVPAGTPPVPPRGTLNESRWDEVLGVAAEIFADKGYRATTMRDLAARLGMEKGSLYYYIEGKEDLLFEILRRGHLQGLSFVSEGPDAGVATPPERLEALIRRWMDGRLHMPASLDVAEFDLRYLSPDRRAEILSLRRAISQVATDIISAGVAEGYFDQSVDPQVASSTTFRILSSTLTWYRPRGDVSWSDLTDWYVRLVIGGLKPAGPDPRPL